MRMRRSVRVRRKKPHWCVFETYKGSSSPLVCFEKKSKAVKRAKWIRTHHHHGRTSVRKTCQVARGSRFK